MSNQDFQPNKFIAELQKRNLWKSLVGFPAGAFIILQVVDFFIGRYGLDPKLLTASLILLVGFLPIVLMWNWNHGEDGHQNIEKGMPYLYLSFGIIAISASLLFYLYGSDPSTYNKEDNSNSAAITERLANLPDKSIAVLPFKDMSKSQDQEYFGDGMAEEILNSLGDLKGLVVAGRTSSYAMKGKGFTINQIGEALKVKTVLQGSIRKDGNKLRVTVQLSETDNGYQLWSTQFDRSYDDIFEIQNEIALEIKERLKLEFSDVTQTNLVEAPTFSNKAYELYLKANFYAVRPPEGIPIAVDLYYEALALDPDFAEAHYKLAWVFNWQAWSGIKTSKEAFEQAFPHAEKAFKLNKKYCREIINYYLWHKYDFAKAEAIMRESGTDQDNFYMVTGDYEKGLEIAQQELGSDPYRILSHLYIIHVYALTGNKEKLREYAEDIRDKFKNISAVQWSLACFSNLILEPEYALTYAESAQLLAGNKGYSRFVVPFAKAKQGKREEVQPFIEEVTSGEFPGDPYMTLTLIYDALGEIDLALDYLEKAYEAGEYLLVYIRSPHLLSNIYDEPRYKAILNKISYPLLD